MVTEQPVRLVIQPVLQRILVMAVMNTVRGRCVRSIWTKGSVISRIVWNVIQPARKTRKASVMSMIELL